MIQQIFHPLIRSTSIEMIEMCGFSNEVAEVHKLNITEHKEHCVHCVRCGKMWKVPDPCDVPGPWISAPGPLRHKGHGFVMVCVSIWGKLGKSWESSKISD
jgi:hypothetical protein